MGIAVRLISTNFICITFNRKTVFNLIKIPDAIVIATLFQPNES
jgi:hypothetical protein